MLPSYLPLVVILFGLSPDLVRCENSNSLDRKSFFNVIEPSYLYKEGGYIHGVALFGTDNQEFGSFIKHSLLYTSSHLCGCKDKIGNIDDFSYNGKTQIERDCDWVSRSVSKIILKCKIDTVKNSCPLTCQSCPRAITKSTYDNLDPFILMVDRGYCTLKEQVANAQALGATAVIIVDLTDTFLAHMTTSFLNSDDSDVSIPSFIIRKIDADSINIALDKSLNVTVDMSWDFPDCSLDNYDGSAIRVEGGKFVDGKSVENDDDRKEKGDVSNKSSGKIVYNNTLAHGQYSVMSIQVGEMGGNIDLSKMIFENEDSRLSYHDVRKDYDVAVFNLYDECSDSLENCDWSNIDIGLKLSSGAVSMCCTSCLNSAGLCDNKDNLIYRNWNMLDYHMKGHNYLNKGRYAVFVVNCNLNSTLTLNGIVEWKSNPKTPFKRRAKFDIGNDFSSILSVCDLDHNTEDDMQVNRRIQYQSQGNNSNSYYGYGDDYYESGEDDDDVYDGSVADDAIYDADDEDASYFNDDNYDDIFNDVDYYSQKYETNSAVPVPKFIKLMDSYFHDSSKQCSNENIVKMNSIFNDFQACAGFDLKGFIEDSPSAIIGTILECVITSDWSSVSDWTDMNQLTSIKFSDRCLNFQYEQNSFGNTIQKVWNHSDIVLPCFTAMSGINKIPSCTIDLHPIPIVGSFLRAITCFSGALTKTLEDVLNIELKVLDRCLPLNGGCEHDCVYEGSILVPNLNFPVSNSMRYIAARKQDRFQSAIDRYQKYLLECTQQWDGWKLQNNSKMQDLELNKKKNHKGLSAKASNVLYFFTGLVAVLILVPLMTYAKMYFYTEIKQKESNRAKVEKECDSVDLTRTSVVTDDRKIV